MYAKEEKIYPAYVSKYNSNGKKLVLLLMISNREKWHYLAVKELTSLLRGITPKSNGDFYCLNCFHFFRTKNKLELHKRECENKDVGNVILPSRDIKVLKFNQYQKFDKPPFIIYVDLEYIIEKIDGCKNNLQQK